MAPPIARGNADTCLDCAVLPPWSIRLCPLHAAAEGDGATLESARAYACAVYQNVTGGRP